LMRLSPFSDDTPSGRARDSSIDDAFQEVHVVVCAVDDEVVVVLGVVALDVVVVGVVVVAFVVVVVGVVEVVVVVVEDVVLEVVVVVVEEVVVLGLEGRQKSVVVSLRGVKMRGR
jgi:hypothetical protein